MSTESISTIRIVEFLDKKNTGAIVIDIRTPGEIQSGKIPDALEMDCSHPDFQTHINALDRTQSYLLCCRSGYRSRQALELFKSLGFADVHDLSGGIIEWIRTGNIVRYTQ